MYDDQSSAGCKNKNSMSEFRSRYEFVKKNLISWKVKYWTLQCTIPINGEFWSFIPSNAFNILMFLLIFTPYCSMSVFGLKLFYLSTSEVEIRSEKYWHYIVCSALGLCFFVYYIFLYNQPNLFSYFQKILPEFQFKDKMFYWYCLL